MTLAPAARLDTQAAPARASLFDSAPKMAVLCVALAQILSMSKLVDVWRTGVFHDTDDAMRLVEVRDWLAGQGWFDLTAYRMDPPAGVFLHWSRIVDAPLALLARVFGLFTTPENAELLMRLAFPALVHLAFFAVFIALGRKLMGARAVAVTALLGLFTMTTTFQFLPGRIDHHGPQIALLVAMVLAALDGLEREDFWPGVLAGAAAALSMGISIENLPFIAAAFAVFGMNWVLRGQPAARPFMGLGLSFAGGMALVFFATVGPARYGYFGLDALSTPWLCAALLGGGACAGLGALSAWLPSLRGCAVAGAAALMILVLVAVVACPDILSDPGLLDPHAGVDPLAREVWLGQVSEAQPLPSIVLALPRAFLPTAIPLVFGLAGLCAAILMDRAARAKWLALLPFAVAGIAAACWEVRAGTSLAPLLALGGAWAVLRCADAAADRPSVWRAAPFAVALPFTSIFWAQVCALAPASAGRAVAASASASSEACYASANLRALDQLSPSLLLGQIDYGGYLLADTRHSVVAAAYHRNGHGNHLAIETFLSAPDAARTFARQSGARYLAICEPSPELQSYAARAPQGLAAALLRGETPGWLAPVSVPGTRFRVFRIE